MRVMALNHSDTIGGAARAAYRIHRAVREQGIDSILRVNQKVLQDATIEEPDGKLAKLKNKFNSGFAQILAKTLRTSPPEYHSLAVMPTDVANEINSSNFDVAHLHWINGEMMSIKDISQITKPLIWTMHEMWGFSGTEHYSENRRWREGYQAMNRPSNESGLDLNRWAWQRKQQYWTKPIQMVTPSHWLAQCISESALMKDWPVTPIANPIDTDQWQPLKLVYARQ